MPEPNPPAPVVPQTPPASDPPATPPTPPAGTRTAAETENELLQFKLRSETKDKEIHRLKEEGKKNTEQLVASRKALVAAGIITGDDPTDAKAIVEKQERDSRAKERREAAIERAALKKLIPTGLGEADADLILGSVLRTSGITFDETTGVVSGLDEVFTALKTTIERLSSKPGGSPPAAAPPAPPAPQNGAAPMDTKFAAIKTGTDFYMAPASMQEEFEAKYPEKARQFDAEVRGNAAKGRSPMFAPVSAGSGQ